MEANTSYIYLLTVIYHVLIVTTCCLAIEALKKLRESKDAYDIVISDVNMPDMDGFKLLEHVGLEMDLPVISKFFLLITFFLFKLCVTFLSQLFFLDQSVPTSNILGLKKKLEDGCYNICTSFLILLTKVP